MDFNVKCKTIKFLGKNMGENLLDLVLGKVLRLNAKDLVRKEKIDEND